MDPKEKEALFLELSSRLTGVAVSSFDRAARQAPKPGDLDPRNAPVRMVSAYLELLESWEGGAGLAKVFDRFTQVRKLADLAGGIAAMLADAELGPICKSITKLWYLGVWYPPDRPRDASHVVSAQAYIESLAWKVMQAHPAGYSMGSFGHWSEDPPPLSEFVTLAK